MLNKNKKILKSIFCTHGARALRTHLMPASVPSLLSSTLPIQLFSPPPPLLPGSLARINSPQSKPVFIKLLWNVGESRYGRSWGLFGRSKILHRSVYSALWLGGLRCQCRRQTNGPLTARCRSVYSALWLGGLRCQCRRQTNGPLTARCPCKNLSAPSVRRPTGKMPGMPDYQSSPAGYTDWSFNLTETVRLSLKKWCLTEARRSDRNIDLFCSTRKGCPQE